LRRLNEITAARGTLDAGQSGCRQSLFAGRMCASFIFLYLSRQAAVGLPHYMTYIQLDDVILMTGHQTPSTSVHECLRCDFLMIRFFPGKQTGI
jgi:hypothetical protein